MVDDSLDQSNTLSKQSVGLLYSWEDVNIHDHPDVYGSDGKLFEPKNKRDDIVYKDTWYSNARKNTSLVVKDRITWLVEKASNLRRHS